jgi:glutamate-1-semialdehyde 2,1-aminomutase
VAAALSTIELLESGAVYPRVPLGDRLRVNARDHRAARLCSDRWVRLGLRRCGGPDSDYDDLLRNDADLFVRYRRELIARGVFELPINLKRNHVMFSHTDADVDRTLEAAEDALRAALAHPSR